MDVVEKFEDAKIDASHFVEMTERGFKELELSLASGRSGFACFRQIIFGIAHAQKYNVTLLEV